MSPCDYAPNAQNKVSIIQTFSARIYVAIVKLDAGHDVMFLQIQQGLGLCGFGLSHGQTADALHYVLPPIKKLVTFLFLTATNTNYI